VVVVQGQLAPRQLLLLLVLVARVLQIAYLVHP
jgi:hypothetical protein